MQTTTYQFVGFNDLLYTWGPRVLGAVVILIVAYIIGKAVKWALAKVLDRVPAISKHNQAMAQGSGTQVSGESVSGSRDSGGGSTTTTGAQLGNVAYWLILLFGIVAALNTLGLGPIVAPLTTMLADVMGYIPNIIGAVLIFFVGFIVASLARRVVTTALQAAHVDKAFSKIGLSGVTGAGIASAVGTVVFVLILIPVAIAALQTLGIEAISAPAITVLSTVLDAIPNVLAAAIVMALGLLIGRWVAGVVERVLPATGFDKALGALVGHSSFKGKVNGATASPEPTLPGLTADVSGAVSPAAGGATPSKVIANLVLFAIIAFSAIEAAQMLKFALIAAIISQVLGLAGHIVAGAAIIGVGVLIADVLANVIRRSTTQADQFAASLVRWATIALATAMGLRFMGIADEIVILAFGLILGSAAVAAALAFGLGGREAAGKVASRLVEKAQQPRVARQAAPTANEPSTEPRPFPDNSAERFQ